MRYVRVAGVAALVDSGRRRAGPGRARSGDWVKFWSGRSRGAGVGLGRRLAPDQRVGRREGGGVGGVLEEPPLAVEPPDVEGEAGRGEEGRDRQARRGRGPGRARGAASRAQAGPRREAAIS